MAEVYEQWLDLSHHNNVKDWDAIAAKYAGVILKATEGNGYVDPTFKTRYQEAKKRGLKIQAYHFARFANEIDARLEAEFFLKTVNGCSFYSNQTVLDLETDDAKLDRGTLTACMMEFSKAIGKNSDFTTVMYSYPSFLKNELEKFSLPLWLADYSADGSYTEELKDEYNIIMVQYTSKGSAPGVTGNVDVNRRFEITKPVPVAQKPPVPAGSQDVYVVQPGDALSKIASKYGLSLSQLLAINPGIKDPDVIYVGQRINVKTAAAPQPAPAKPAQLSATVYTVQPGDALSKIASKFGVDDDAIAQLNGIKNKNLIYAGQKLRIPGKAAAAKPAPAAPKPVYHNVVSGDAVSKLAAKYGSSQAEIKAWNKLADVNKIFVGQTLRVK
ncbi:LysM peptidoglycan-binding domain-containing protein [Bacillota bacterium Lsc_1132]